MIKEGTSEYHKRRNKMANKNMGKYNRHSSLFSKLFTVEAKLSHTLKWF